MSTTEKEEELKNTAEGENLKEASDETLKADATEESESVGPDENVSDIKEAKVEEVDFKAKFYYMAAELDNLQKRHTREREKLIKFGNEKILSSLLDVVDNFERTLEASSSEEDEKVKNLMTGINMVRDQFITTLKSNGLEEVKTLGEIFDPNFHEALAQQPAEGKKDQEILQEYQKGYLLNGRLLRAAKVVVTNNN